MAGKKVKDTPDVQLSRSNAGAADARHSSLTVHSSSVGRFFWRGLAIIIGAVFIYAGAVKIIDPAEFARDIDNYKMLSWQMSVWLALYLPWLEIFCGLALIAHVLYRGGVFILTGLMALFVVMTIVAKARGLDISCGCFGHASKYLSFAWHLVLDFFLLGGLLLLLKKSSAPLTDARTL